MPTDQPNSAPDDLPETPRDDATAATVLHDENLDDAPGGGGLGGAAASNPLGGSARAPGGASPNSPIDTGLSGGDMQAAGEAKLRATDDGANG